MRADLHLHSLCSDGKYTPEAVAAKCKEAGLSLFSLTDHDSMEGVPEALSAAKELGISCVPGWEVSAYEDVKVHVLGYGCAREEAYFRFLQERKESALVRAEDMIGKGNEYLGLSVSLKDALALRARPDAPLHTMHVVTAFSQRLGVKKGELYLSAFAAGCPCYSDLCRPTPFDAVAVIHAAGGIASLAHPGRIPMEQDAKFALMDRLVEAGLDSIECYHSDHTPNEAETFAAYARDRGLYETGGSDFHVEGRNRVIGLPPFEPSEALLAALSRAEGDQ